MAKSADAFRTISEVSEWLDTPAHVLRFWESKFSQVKPVKRAGGRRYYRPSDMELLGGIKRLLHEDGMTIKGVQKMLREKGVAHVSEMSQPLDAVTAAVRDAMDPKAKAEAETPVAKTPDQPAEEQPAPAVEDHTAAREITETLKDDTIEAPMAEDTPALDLELPVADTAPETVGEPVAEAPEMAAPEPLADPAPIEAPAQAAADAPVPKAERPRPTFKAVPNDRGPTVLTLALARKTRLEDAERAELRRLATQLQNWLARQTA
ncbi:MerR HTH family regulatory protein [Pseudooceanicola nitratireducens]|jgi:DNA-binding transcriptional MerR regulator|uniref:MerR HTH family regulatory protein n=1 Tax=Pseudooceanicola nitratireducens TaxID=517719 RepID=A0A1I1LPN3_9RHOB|nr:MerR family transcriptional regulator [Pseudooceanicola nitratireducens]SEJ64946.1 MerR HTH family regulatory protein [Pseudooceanicola nitratireducens]SFC75031.1 MerR HTH family regulatory protein [Pseudooceanicola nitratireducens]